MAPTPDTLELTAPEESNYTSGVFANGNYLATIGDRLGSSVIGYNHEFDFLLGDLNDDRKIDITDYGIVSSNFRSSGMTYTEGDLNYDGTVDVSDLGIISAYFGAELPPPPSILVFDVTATSAVEGDAVPLA